MTLTMPPKGVDAVNSLKSDLQENIERFSKIDSTHSSYKECHDKIGTALKKLGKLDINVATLHVTKIGKLMTKYERELSKELSNIAKDNNVKWKELLNAYREEFKKKKFIKLNEVKEEPLSQNSYNDLLASQEEPCDEDDDDVRDEPNNEMNDSFDMLLASQGFGPDNDNENVFLTSTPMNQELPHTKKNDTITNNTSPDKTIDVPSKHFLTDMRGVVGTLTTTLSTVEIECTKMKTMIEYLNNKLNDYENNLFHQRRCVSTSSKSNPIKETFEKTGRAVMPKLLKPSPGKNKSPTSTEPSENSILYTSNHRISRVSNTDKSKQPSTSNNDSNNSTCSNIQKSVHSSTMSINNDHIENACNGININDVNMENLNPCTSSNVDETLPYPLSLIKQEPDDGIEFHRLSNSNSPNNPSADENDNTKKKEESEKNVSQKMKRKSFDENNVVPSKITHGNNNINSISDKISQISQSLKRRSIDENTIADTPSPSNTKNSLLYRESPNSSGISLKGSGESSRSRSSVFDVDSDGFTIPKVVNQNDIQLSGEQVLLKGVQTTTTEINSALTIDLSTAFNSTPSSKIRKVNRCITFIKKELTKVYTPSELASSSVNGGSRRYNNKQIEKQKLSPDRLEKLLRRARFNFEDEFDAIKDINEVVNSKCRKESHKLMMKEKFKGDFS